MESGHPSVLAAVVLPSLRLRSQTGLNIQIRFVSPALPDRICTFSHTSSVCCSAEAAANAFQIGIEIRLMFRLQRKDQICPGCGRKIRFDCVRKQSFKNCPNAQIQRLLASREFCVRERVSFCSRREGLVFRASVYFIKCLSSHAMAPKSLSEEIL